MDPSPTSIAKCPCDGCDLPVDVVFLSADGKKIGGHSSSLEAFSEAFPPLGMVVNSGEKVPLTESGSTLEALFHFTHKRQYDQIFNGITLGDLLDLAEASHKYLIYHAMEICRLHLKMRWKEDPLSILAFATKHQYHDLADTTAPATLWWSLAQVEKSAGDNKNFVLAWLRYYHTWMEVAEFALTRPPPYINSKKKIHECPNSSAYFAETLAQMPRTTSETVKRLVNGGIPGTYFDIFYPSIAACPVCPSQVTEWKQEIIRRKQAIPLFHHFLV